MSEVQEESSRELIVAAHQAAATIGAFYQWIDMIQEAGGCGSIAGIAKANAFIASMNKNRARLDALVMEPLNAAIAKAKGDA